MDKYEDIKYSIVLYDTGINTQKLIEEIIELIKKGIKVILFHDFTDKYMKRDMKYIDKDIEEKINNYKNKYTYINIYYYIYLQVYSSISGKKYNKVNKIDVNYIKKSNLINLYCVSDKVINLNTQIQPSTLNIISKDGENLEDVRTLSKVCDLFNLEQYEIEHYEVDYYPGVKDENLIVSAGAGSGKTHTMIDRIMYLLSTRDNIKPRDIHMITFTRDSTKEMRDRIQGHILRCFKITKNVKYMKYLENISNMKICTIDSYFNNIASDIGVVLNYNKSTTIRNLNYEKKQLIKEIILSNDEIINLYDEIELYNLEKYIFKVWKKLYSLGLSDKEIKSLECDNAISEDNVGCFIDNKNGNILKKIIEESFKKLPDELSKKKKERNIKELRDIAIDILINYKKNGVNYSLKKYMDIPEYIFVDEFQDTNKTQIDIIVWLWEQLKCKLFVVGDTKQAIYRFRGTENTAFLTLEEKLGKYNVKILSLKKNYRTCKKVLDTIQNEMKCEYRNLQLKNKFGKTVYKKVEWGNPYKNELLIPVSKEEGNYEVITINTDDNIKSSLLNKIDSYSQNDKLDENFKNLVDSIINILNRKSNEETTNIVIEDKKKVLEIIKVIVENYEKDKNKVNKLRLKEEIVDEIKEEIETYLNEYMCVKTKLIDIVGKYIKNEAKQQEENEPITVLVRTNEQAKEVKLWCKESGIVCNIDTKGTFFISRAVRDFYSLVGAYLYGSNEYIVNMISTPYIKIDETKESIAQKWANQINIDTIKSCILEILENNNFEKYKQKFRTDKFLVVIREIIRESEVVNNFYQEILNSCNNKEDAEAETNKYQKNLNKLLDIIRKNLGQTANLLDVYDYLKIQIAKNREEDEENVEIKSSKAVNCITVHKSKGRQFKTVIIPFTNNVFSYSNKDEIIIQENKVYWNLYNSDWKSTNKFTSQNYKEIFNTVESEELINDEKRLLYVALTRVINKLIVIRLEVPKENTWGAFLPDK